MRYFMGIDVGTGSVRAGIFDEGGRLAAAAKQDIQVFHAPHAIVEQSSSDIWRAVCRSVKNALAASQLRADDIAGIGFDATCSLVVLGEGGVPLPVGPSEDPERNIIVWMDHRAVNQARRINATAHPVLKYVGGRISPEMETPKLLWLLENRPHVFDAAWQFLDLTDFLTWRATGDLARSTCTVTCKWTYLAHERRWDDSYFHAVGLDVLASEDFARIGQEVVDAGTPLGAGLTEAAARELGLNAGTPVGAGLIDAHAGGIGTVGAGAGGAASCLAYVFGTSSCTMTTTADPVFVPGVWGPYFSAMVPGTWLNEGGQSVAGAAIDQLLSLHPATPEARTMAAAAGQSLPDFLADAAARHGDEASGVVRLAQGRHVLPEFLGNRAPFADPEARAMMAGLGMDRSIDDLVALYVAGLCGIGYGLRQIIDAQAAAGAPIESVVISGGAGRHDLVRQLLADATGRPVVATASDEPVLLGAAILGAVAAQRYDDVPAAMKDMSAVRCTYRPSPGTTEVHLQRYRAFGQMQAFGKALRHC
ncbi:FGGY-family carbohydrate kinase [Rhizobacter sp. Root1221]|uniref:FGGY-family carbohydrate kinase n=1 Tax=Rhizobacter sp. Root1221 TaxID=1736433 RepID=UPI0006F2BA43|nr:FGGY-family carbohydrate kinase [Rhizobacter sp. Root1221]KQV81304.1 ribulokinase [Rhizobacter sp. Root1221]